MRPVPDNHPGDCLAVCTQCEPNPHLSCPPGDRVRNYSIESDSSQQKCQPAEDAEEDSFKARTTDGIAHVVVKRLNVQQRQRRIQRLDLTRQRGQQVSRGDFGAHDHRHVHHRQLSVGDIRFRNGTRTQTFRLYITHYTYNHPHGRT